MKKVKEQRQENNNKKRDKKKKEEKEKTKGQVVIPYVQGLSEAVDRVMCKHGVAVAMKPHMTLRRLLVHPKDKNETCKNCDSVFIGETGRLFGTRLEEHMKEIKELPNERKYTRSERKTSERTMHRSATTDHHTQLNHIIDWEGANIRSLTRRQDRCGRPYG